MMKKMNEKVSQFMQIELLKCEKRRVEREVFVNNMKKYYISKAKRNFSYFSFLFLLLSSMCLEFPMSQMKGKMTFFVFIETETVRLLSSWESRCLHLSSHNNEKQKKRKKKTK